MCYFCLSYLCCAFQNECFLNEFCKTAFIQIRAFSEIKIFSNCGERKRELGLKLLTIDWIMLFVHILPCLHIFYVACHFSNFLNVMKHLENVQKIAK